MPDAEDSDLSEGKQGNPTVSPQPSSSGNHNKPTDSGNWDPATEDKEATTKLEQDIRTGERWLIGIGIATVIINTVIAVIYWRQLSEMRKTAEAAIRSADVAKQAADIANQTLGEIRKGGNDTHDLAVTAGKEAEASRAQAEAALAANRLTEESIRGRVAITNIRLAHPISVGQGITAVVNIENVGHSVVSEQVGSDAKEWVHLPDGPMPISMQPPEVNEPGAKGTALIFSGNATPELVNGIGVPGHPTVYFFGRVNYQTLGKSHYVEFCAYVMRLDTTTIPRTPATESLSVDTRFALRKCDKWHESK